MHMTKEQKEKHKSAMAAWYKKRESMGLCRGCGKPESETGIRIKAHCSECLKTANLHAKKRSQRLYLSGICTICGSCPPTEGFKSCEPCRVRHKLRMQEKIKNGFCRICRMFQVRPGKVDCQVCNDFRIEKMRTDYFLIKKAIFDHYGGVCVCCGYSDTSFLEVDHINNDGYIERQKGLTGTMFYKWLVKNNFPPGYQLLCSNCNCGKARHGGVCHHKHQEKQPFTFVA